MLYEILNFAIPNANIKESGLCLNADSGFQCPVFWISQAKIFWIPESGLPYMGRN